MSPERLNPVQFNIKDSRPTKESDCYALGMVVLEVLSGQVPFTREVNDLMVMNKVLEGERPGRPEGAEGVWFTDDLWATLQVCWSRQPSDRPTVEDVLECLSRNSTAWQPLAPSVDYHLQMDSDEESYYTIDAESLLEGFPLLQLGIEPRLIPPAIPPFPDVQATALGLNVDPPSSPHQKMAMERFTILVEGNSYVCPNFSHAHCRNAFPILVETGLSGAPPDSFTQPKPRSKFPKREGSGGSQVSLPSSTPRPTPKTRFTFPGTGLDPQEPEKPYLRQQRRRKSAYWAPRRVRTTVNVLRMIFRMKRFSKAQGSPMG